MLHDLARYEVNHGGAGSNSERTSPSKLCHGGRDTTDAASSFARAAVQDGRSFIVERFHEAPQHYLKAPRHWKWAEGRRFVPNGDGGVPTPFNGVWKGEHGRRDALLTRRCGLWIPDPHTISGHWTFAPTSIVSLLVPKVRWQIGDLKGFCSELPPQIRPFRRPFARTGRPKGRSTLSARARRTAKSVTALSARLLRRRDCAVGMAL